MRQTKIVATLGPSSSNYEQIRALFEAGVDVFRLNFSHGVASEHEKRVKIIRQIEEEMARPIGILADLQGPKLRLGVFEHGAISLKRGQKFRLDLLDVAGDEARAPLPHPEIFAALSVGARLLLDDGKVRLRVLECGSDFALTEVEVGDKLSDRKGVNVPDAMLNLSPLTPKDREDMETALAIGADWIALSFVQRPEDVVEAKQLVGSRAAVLAKLEKPSAINELKEILEVADGVMVARGDLGVEMPPEDVPRLQKKIIRRARWAGKPVIVATQMLESMISAPTPTRAEASDVATAVYDRADAVMLSAETASGDYPVEAVRMMDRIIRHTQKDLFDHPMHEEDRAHPMHTQSDAITIAARQIVETMKASAIITYTTTGNTTLRAARERPETPVLGLTPDQKTARRLVLSYGVYAALTEDAQSFAEMVQNAVIVARRSGLVQVGDNVVITAGVPFGKAGSTNILRIANITDDVIIKTEKFHV
ncbi:MAG: pyruvate kinase [Bdellovibrionales bacterium]